jgi:hypothetical protein
MTKIIGVHSNVTGDAKLTDGHAWITLHFSNGRHTSIGLWDHTPTLLNAKNLIYDKIGVFNATAETFDVEWGLEEKRGYRAKASRYYGLSEGQTRAAVAALGAYSGWRFSNTCATWATHVVIQLTGEELDSEELLGYTNTPRALGNAIQKLEARHPTSLRHPRSVINNPITGAIPRIASQLEVSKNRTVNG